MSNPNGNENSGMACSHCSHPQYVGLRCGVCGRWSDDRLPVKTYSGEKPNYITLPEMWVFAAYLKANPDKAREFFQRAGVLDEHGNLTEAYR